jgi:hypothetical protein
VTQNAGLAARHVEKRIKRLTKAVIRRILQTPTNTAMDIKLICPNPSCQQLITVDASQRGSTMQCPACHQSLTIPAQPQTTPHPSNGLGKKIALGIVACCVVIAVGLSLAMFLKHSQPVPVQSAPATVATVEEPANPPRYNFLTNEMWLKPLHGDLDGVKAILDKNPQRLEERVGGMRATLLHIAAYGGQPAVVAELLRRGADVSLRTKQGHTPLYDCIEGSGTAEIAKMLLDAKSDVTIADNAGKTPLQLAIERNKTDIADLLRQHGAEK